MSVKALLVVFCNCVEGTDEEFNRWYNETHGPDIIKIGVAVGFTRYKSVGIPVLPGLTTTPDYAVIYELAAETEEQIEQAAALLRSSIDEGHADVSPTQDLSTVIASWLLPITDRIDAGAAGIR